VTLGRLIGLLVLWVTLTDTVPPESPTRVQVLGVVVPRFSDVAFASVVVLLATGTGATIFHMPALDALWDTSYGVAILVKIGILTAAVVLASGNPGKVREIEAIAHGALELVLQSTLGIAEAGEPHASFVENALAKARHASRAARIPARADDSGLCVEALGGEPGVHSAYYAGREGGREERSDGAQGGHDCERDGREEHGVEERHADAEAAGGLPLEARGEPAPAQNGRHDKGQHSRHDRQPIRNLTGGMYAFLLFARARDAEEVGRLYLQWRPRQ